MFIMLFLPLKYNWLFKKLQLKYIYFYVKIVGSDKANICK